MRDEDRIDRRCEEGRRPAIGAGRWTFFLLPLLFSVLTGPAFALRFNANWDYQQAGGEGVPTQNEFRQRYSLGAGTTLTARPSHAIVASAGVSYTRSQGNDSRGSRARDNLTPNAQVNLMNDIFTAQLSGTTDVSTPDDHRSSTATSWNSSLGSSWDMPYWPRVRLNYGEQTVEADEEDLFPGQTVTNRGLSLDWDLLLAQINYQFNATEMEVDESDMKTESDSHFVRLETGATFWQNRLRFHLTQTYTQSNQEAYSGSRRIRTPISGGVLSGVTNPSVLLDPLPGESWPAEQVELSLGLGGGQEDGLVSGLTVESGDRVHLVFVQEEILSPVDSLRLTFDPLTLPSEEQIAELQWNLYLRGASGWELVQANLPFLYTKADRLIDLDIGRFEQEIMVAAVNRTGIPLTISEFRAFTAFTGDGSTSSSTSVSTLTNFSFGYRITQHLSASGSLILNRSDFNHGDLENDRQTVSGSLQYTAFPLLIPALGYSESRAEQTDREDTLNRSYSFVLSSRPLPTANLSFGITLGEQYLGSRKTNTSTRYTLSSRAAIYPDLSAAAVLSYGQSEFWREGGEVDDSDSLSGRLNLHARLRPNVNADLTTTYSQTRNAGGSFQGGEVRTGLRYLPSEFLSLRGAYTTYYGDEDKSSSLNLGATLMILNTTKTRLTFNASHYQEEDARQTLSLLGNWKISRSLSFWSRANYLIADQNVYSFQVNLALGL